MAAKPKNPIKVTLPDGKQVDATSWESTAYDVAKGISQGLADNTVIAKVNGVLWDLDRVLEQDCSLQLLKFDDPEAQAVFWHSSAHMMGEAMERCYGGHLCYGPPIDGGFYYDMFLEGDGVSHFLNQIHKTINTNNDVCNDNCLFTLDKVVIVMPLVHRFSSHSLSDKSLPGTDDIPSPHSTVSIQSFQRLVIS